MGTQKDLSIIKTSEDQNTTSINQDIEKIGALQITSLIEYLNKKNLEIEQSKLDWQKEKKRQEEEIHQHRIDQTNLLEETANASKKKIDELEKEKNRLVQEIENQKQILLEENEKLNRLKIQGLQEHQQKLEAELNEKLLVLENKVQDYNEQLHEITTKRASLIIAEEEAKTNYQKLYSEFLEKQLKKTSEFDEIFKRKETEFENKILNDLRTSLENKIAEEKDKKLKEIAELDIEIKEKQTKLNQDILNTIKKEVELEDQKNKCERIISKYEARLTSLDDREQNLDETIDSKVNENIRQYKESTQIEIKILTEEITRLRDFLDAKIKEGESLKSLEIQLGGRSPEIVIKEMDEKRIVIESLKQDLETRPGKEIQERFQQLQHEKNRADEELKKIKSEYEAMKEQFSDQQEIQNILDKTTTKLEDVEYERNILQKEQERLREELNRLYSAYDKKSDRDQRIKDIETPFYEKDIVKSKVFRSTTDEIKLLHLIEKNCTKAGIQFHSRIMNSFHTAIKTSDLSPLTILSGVSGTGKSELPKLYSLFAGFVFLSVPVQPNWDSQESMLGYFNSIDNKFEATSILKLLAQSQKTANVDYPFGLDDTMVLILLDEMNLAHIELYFADFLSKFETRRSASNHDIPSIEVKLGSGLSPYLLKLGKNVLWTGTMNQDETTKSLSDKVIDRGISIFFPRPEKLYSKNNAPITSVEKTSLLKRETWESWIVKKIIDSFTPEQSKPFREIIEEMNSYLAFAGRALGHRVWQSVEFYMANYPLVRKHKNDSVALEKAMKIAFEDQLVQKVMPKLRGIETRGKTKSDCLDKIRNLLEKHQFNIIEDFDRACEFGYGQFMWHSASYLDKSNDFNTMIKAAYSEVEATSKNKKTDDSEK
jgi:hypothetical protein